MKTKMVCIMCPLGCEMEVEKVGDEVIVSGNNCIRGKVYATSEMTNPERMVNDAPPSLEATTTSLVCKALGLVKIFVNSGISAAPRVPQLIIIESTSHKLPPKGDNK